MFPTDSTFRPAPKPTITAPKPLPPPPPVALKAQNPVNVAHVGDGMMPDRLSQVKANAYKLGGTGAPVMSWVDPPGTAWPRGPLTPDGGKTVQPGVDQVQD